MTKHKGITIELTPAQLSKLAPAFRTQKRIKGSAIAAQVLEDGMRVNVIDPEVVIGIHNVISKHHGLKPQPPRLISSVHELGKGRKCLDAQTSDFEECKAEVVAMARGIRRNGTAETLETCETFRELVLAMEDLKEQYFKRGWMEKIDPISDRIWIRAGRPRGF